MKSKILISCVLACSLFNAYADDSACVAGKAVTSNSYHATKWYRDSAEKNALYNQAFTIGLEKITAKTRKMKKGSWGVILDIDETVLDNSEFEKRRILKCGPFDNKSIYAFIDEKISVATPGAKHLTCAIEKMGGKVVLVTNRDGTYASNVKQSTIDNLESQGICFDNVVFTDGEGDNNKTERFNEITKGNYSDLVATKRLPPLKIVAYFGDSIQDFPGIRQGDAIKEDPNSSFYQKFGEEYFLLPNPIYGSWEKNEFK